nr:unnamed protein product [Digitaria exilis]
MADEWTKTKVFRIVLRIATVVFSIWSWIKTTKASQTMQDGTTITSSDYPSFQYSSVSELVSAILQGVAILLEMVGHKKCSKCSTR